MLSIEKIIEVINPKEVHGNVSGHISELISADIENEDSDALMWVSNKRPELLNGIKKGVIICGILPEVKRPECLYFLVENPRWTFLEVIRNFFQEEESQGISKTASIDPSTQIGQNVFIGHNVVVEKDCVIGDGSKIDHNTVIKSRTIIGKGCKIGSNCVIGGVGFGYEKSAAGEYELIPHIGNVKMEEFVEIGNNTCIDRAVLGSTLLEKNVKVDNLVHIAHGVQIGQNSLIIANAMVAGSVQVGENVWVAPSSSIINGKKVGDNAIIGLSAVVIKDVENGQIIIGNPGKPLEKKKR